MDKEELKNEGGQQETSEAEKVLGSLPNSFEEFKKSVSAEEQNTTKNPETCKDVRYAKTQKRIREAAARGYDVDRYVRNLEYDGGSDGINLIAHSLETLKDLGADMDYVFYELPWPSRVRNIEFFKDIDPNFDIDKKLFSKEDDQDLDFDPLEKLGNPQFAIVAENLDILLKNGANINVDELVSNLSAQDIAKNLDSLERNGANIDVADLSTKLRWRTKAQNLSVLNQYGANINVEELVSELRPGEIAESLDELKNNGAEINIDELVPKLELREVARFSDSLNRYGANIELATLIKTPKDLRDVVKFGDVDLKTLKEHGVEIEKILSDNNTSYGMTLYDLDYTSELGVKVEDLNNAISDQYEDGTYIIPEYHVIDNIDALIENGVDINLLIKRFSDKNGLMDYETHSMLENSLERNGLNPDNIRSKGGLYGPYHYES